MEQSTTMLASDLFGGSEAVRKAVFHEIHEAFLREGFTVDQLSCYTGRPTNEIESVFAAPNEKLTGAFALSLMAPLGIALDKALRLRELSTAEREYWTGELRHDGRVAGEGDGPGEPDPSIELGLFLRFRAMDEIG